MSRNDLAAPGSVDPERVGDTMPMARTDRFRPALLAAGGLALAAALGSDEGVVLCPYRRCTGGDCPLCGATRAAASLLRADLAGSWARHPLVPLLALQLGIGVVVATLARRAGRDLAELRAVGQRVLLLNLALATAIWVVRLVGGAVAGPAHLSLPF